MKTHTSNLTSLMTIILGIGVIATASTSHAGGNSLAGGTTFKTVTNTPSGSGLSRVQTSGSNSTAYSLKGTTSIDTKTGQAKTSGNVSTTMNGKATGFWQGQDGYSYFNPLSSYVYYDRNDGIAKVAVAEPVTEKKSSSSPTSSSSGSALKQALGIPSSKSNSQTTSSSSTFKDVLTGKSSSSSSYHTSGNYR